MEAPASVASRPLSTPRLETLQKIRHHLIQLGWSEQAQDSIRPEAVPNPATLLSFRSDWGQCWIIPYSHQGVEMGLTFMGLHTPTEQTFSHSFRPDGQIPARVKDITMGLKLMNG